MAQSIRRSGVIHEFDGVPPAFAFDGRPVPVDVVEPGSGTVLASGSVASARLEGSDLWADIDWPEDMEARAGDSAPAAHCEFDESGRLARVLVEFDCGCHGCTAGGACCGHDHGDDHGHPAEFKGGGARAKGGASGGKSKSKLTGGRWATIGGHPVYIKDGQVVAGGIPGVTHAKGKKKSPKGNPADIDRADVPLARRHVVRKAKAEKIRRNAPGKDASGVDHEALKAHVAKEGAAYSHGAPKSAADRKHLEAAEKAGGVAVKATVRPKVRMRSDEESTRYIIGDRVGVTVSRKPDRDGKYRVDGLEDDYHGSLKSAEKAGRKAAAKVVERDTEVRRLVVKGKGLNKQLDQVAGQAGAGRKPDHELAEVRVLHRGRGSAATFHAPLVVFAPAALFHAPPVAF